MCWALDNDKLIGLKSCIHKCRTPEPTPTVHR